MGKDDKEDSGFGFKDRAKAEETLKLLEQHDPNYRRLTVRGLLGRAKRVLSMTKAEEKIKNIKEAMEVFENWLAELDGNKQKDKPEKAKKETKEKRKSSDKAVQAAHERHYEEQLKWRKKFAVWFEQKKAFIDSLEEPESSQHKPDEVESSEDEDLPSESVSGLGFKDPEAARGSLKALEGRDPDYQLLAVKGLLGRAKRVLTCTKDETKLSNIKEAMSILESFVDDFDTKHMSRDNCPYLSLGIVKTAEGLAGDSITEDQKSFIAAYTSVRGNYKRLRNVGEDGNTWDIRRNVALKELKEKNAEAKLFTSNNDPTPQHLEYILWAYSPEAAKVKKVVNESQVPDIDKLKIDRKRKSSGDGECENKKKKQE